MSQGVRWVRFEGDESKTIAEVPSAQVETGAPIAKRCDGDPLKHFQNVTNSVVQDALNVWADLWAELENDVACGVAVTPKAEGCQPQDVAMESPEKGLGTPIAKDRDREPFQPSCGWPEFLEKMWVLRQNLDFLARFSRQ